jgi:hypothetical protein
MTDFFSPRTAHTRHWFLATAAALLLAACGGADKSAPEPSSSDGSSAATAAAAATPTASTDEANKQLLALGIGSTQTSTSLRDAVRLADQATFGASEALITSLRGQGIEAWLAAQLVATGSSYTSGKGDLIHKPYVENFCGVFRDTPDCYSTEPLVWDF